MPTAELAANFLLLALFTWVMARDMKRRPGAGFFHAVMRGFVPVMLVSVVGFFGMQGPGGEEMEKYRQAFVDTYSRVAMEVYGGRGLDAGRAREAAEIFFRLQPGIQSLFWLAVLTAVAFVLRRVLARRGQSGPPPPLSRWQAPDALIWVLLLPAALVLSERLGWVGNVEPLLRDLSLNVLVVILAVYLFQGMMVLVERLRQAGLPKPLGAFLVLLALAFALVPQGRGPAAALLLLGIFDTWFDLRNLKPKARDDERSKP